MNAYVFPGQGSQFSGMCQDLYIKNSSLKEFFDRAEAILGFNISKIMFEGTKEELTKTRVTQPAIFIHSMAIIKVLGNKFKPAMVAGHSLGEFSALAAAGALSFEDGLKLVSLRANAMQRACENNKGTMAAVLALDEKIIEDVCNKVDGIVVAANYNCPGQVVISGEINSVKESCKILAEKGARRALILPVSGAFHSSLMNTAKEELSQAIKKADFKSPICPIYQNYTAKEETDINKIKINLISQLTSPVKWTQSVNQMIKNGASKFIEVGPGKVLQGLIKKIDNKIEIQSELF
ncbi:MAG: ACP S-malonyltransferase [Flavobacteriaceae bacterium]